MELSPAGGGAGGGHPPPSETSKYIFFNIGQNNYPCQPQLQAFFREINIDKAE